MLDKRISPEVSWYLESRGIPQPDCPPAFVTPEPRKVPDARFDPERVDRVLDVFSRLRHTKGEWAGRPLNPDPWQIAYFIAPVFGWIQPDGKGGWVRIIRKVFCEVPRKNGKSTLAGGIAVYLVAADGEAGAEVYALASGEKQARYVFDPVKALAKSSPDLKPHVKTLRDRIVHNRTGSYFAVMSRVADPLHGANVHGAIVDELHLHKSPDLLNAVESGMGARRQPLMVIITTAGSDNNESIYAKRHERIEELSRGVIQDPATFGAIWAASPKDDPFAETTWKKANPGYGISPSASFMASEAKQAQQSPSDLSSFKRLHLNVRTSLEAKVFDLRTWDASAGVVVEDQLKAKKCFGGLDLSQTRDLTAFVMVFPPDDREHGKYQAICRFWIPEENVDIRSRTDGVDYRSWIDQGFVRTTTGNAIDYETIERDIKADAARFALQEVAFDRAFAYQIGQRLDAAGIQMIPIRQTAFSMGPPMSDLIALLRDKRFQHGGHQVLRWMADATIAEQDANGLKRPSKRKSTQRIDGIVAAIMALDRAIREEPHVSWVVL